MKPKLSCCLLILALTAFSGVCFAQGGTSKKSRKIAAIREMISSGRYVFQAQSAQPMGGRNRQLTPEYTLQVTPDTVGAYLPYFGRAYTAPMDPTKGGIQFTSARFDNKTESQKKGGWSITIKPQDVRDIQQLNLRVSAEGYATLNVTSTQRQPITFTGIIVEKR